MSASKKSAPEIAVMSDYVCHPKENAPRRCPPRRRRLSAADRGDYLELFGGRWLGGRPTCILCGTEHAYAVEAHIYDKPTESEVDKIVPLCGTCNGEYEITKRTGGPPLWYPRDPDSVANIARSRFFEGRFAAANALYRLAAYLFRTRRNAPENALQCLSAAIAAVRPLGNATLLKRTLSDVMETCPALSRRSLLFGRAECLSQISLLLYDYGERLKSYFVQEKANDLRKSLTFSAWSILSTTQEQDRLNQERRIVWTACGVDRSMLVDSSRVDSHWDDLVNNVDTFAKCENYKGCVDNLGVHAYRAILQDGPGAHAVHEAASMAFHFATKHPNPWAIANHHLNEGRYQFLQWRHSKSPKARRAAQEHLMDGLSLLDDRKIKPQPPARDGLLPVDKMLEQLSLSDWVRFAQDVLKPREPFPLEWEFMRNVIDGLSGTL